MDGLVRKPIFWGGVNSHIRSTYVYQNNEKPASYIPANFHGNAFMYGTRQHGNAFMYETRLLYMYKCTRTTASQNSVNFEYEYEIPWDRDFAARMETRPAGYGAITPLEMAEDPVTMRRPRLRAAGIAAVSLAALAAFSALSRGGDLIPPRAGAWMMQATHDREHEGARGEPDDSNQSEEGGEQVAAEQGDDPNGSSGVVTHDDDFEDEVATVTTAVPAESADAAAAAVRGGVALARNDAALRKKGKIDAGKKVGGEPASKAPTPEPTTVEYAQATPSPSRSFAPSAAPSAEPFYRHFSPTPAFPLPTRPITPTMSPSARPTPAPSEFPSYPPSIFPTYAPTSGRPIPMPSAMPTLKPTDLPSREPTSPCRRVSTDDRAFGDDHGDCNHPTAAPALTDVGTASPTWHGRMRDTHEAKIL